MKMRLIGDVLSLELFRLAGVSGECPRTGQEVESAIEKHLADADVGVVLVTHSRASMLGGGFRKYLQRRRLPLVLRIPDRHGRAGEAGELREYLQRTLGIRL